MTTEELQKALLLSGYYIPKISIELWNAPTRRQAEIFFTPRREPKVGPPFKLPRIVEKYTNINSPKVLYTYQVSRVYVCWSLREAMHEENL